MPFAYVISQAAALVPRMTNKVLVAELSAREAKARPPICRLRWSCQGHRQEAISSLADEYAPRLMSIGFELSKRLHQ